MNVQVRVCERSRGRWEEWRSGDRVEVLFYCNHADRAFGMQYDTRKPDCRAYCTIDCGEVAPEGDDDGAWVNLTPWRAYWRYWKPQGDDPWPFWFDWMAEVRFHTGCRLLYEYAMSRVLPKVRAPYVAVYHIWRWRWEVWASDDGLYYVDLVHEERPIDRPMRWETERATEGLGLWPPFPKRGDKRWLLMTREQALARYWSVWKDRPRVVLSLTCNQVRYQAMKGAT